MMINRHGDRSYRELLLRIGVDLLQNLIVKFSKKEKYLLRMNISKQK